MAAEKEHVSQLVLSFLGPPRLELDGRPVEPGRRKVLALLAYLAVTGRRHSRDTLAYLLYPRQDRDHAYADLRQTLSVLRGAVGARYLDVHRDSVCLAATEGVFVDAVAYRGLAAECRNGNETEGTLVRATDLVRGPFLEGFYLRDSPAFEEWQLAEAESVRREQVFLLGRLVSLYEARLDYPRAIEAAVRLLDQEPLEEKLHRSLMLLYALSGHRSSALRQYDRCRSLLEVELGRQPDAETDRLRARIEPGGLAAPALQERPLHLGADAPSYQGPPMVLAVESAGVAGATVVPSLRAAIDSALEAQRRHSGLARAALHPAGPSDQPGLAVAAALRILRAAGPGQILLSLAAAELPRGALPDGVELRALGTHRLDDLGSPVPLFQLVHPDLDQHPVRLRTLDSVPNNFRTQPTPFVGRTREVAEAASLLADQGVSLLTLTGVGGTGKSRLALQTAARVAPSFEHGAYLVELASVKDVAALPATIMAALGVTESLTHERATWDELALHLRRRTMLLVLDNLEQLLPSAAAPVAELLSACPGLKLLITSREALRVRAEHEMAVDPLPVPGEAWAPSEIETCESVILFRIRAERVVRGFRIDPRNAAAVAGICRRLEGLPLSIELAAGRLTVFTPEELAEGLERRLALLVAGPPDLPARQRTLRDELDWSYRLLDDGDRVLFRHLGVFPGRWDVESAAAVAAISDGRVSGRTIDGLSSLVNKSLVRRDQAGRAAVFDLLETVREYAAERLEEHAESEGARTRLVAHLLDLAQRADPALRGPAQSEWFERLEIHLDSIRWALRWLHDRRDLEAGSRLAAAMGWFWFRRQRFAEGKRWLELFHDAGGCEASVRARMAYYLGWMEITAGNQFQNSRSLGYFWECVDLARAAGDRKLCAMALAWCGCMSVDSSPEVRNGLCEQGVLEARAIGDPWVLALCLKIGYSYLPRVDRDPAFKAAMLKEAVGQAERCGDPYLVAETTHGMGDVYFFLGDHAAAEPWFRSAVRLARAANHPWLVCDSLWQIARGYVATGRLREGKGLLHEGLRVAEAIGARGHYDWYLRGLAQIGGLEHEPRRCMRLLGGLAAMHESAHGCPAEVAESLDLSPEQAEAEWNAGRGMSVDQLIAYALSEEEQATGDPA